MHHTQRPAARRRSTLRRLALGLTLAAALSACTAIYRNHGYVPPEQDLAQITVGTSTRDDVAALVGTPSAAGLLEGSGWYYVGSRWRHFGPRAPQEVSREVVAIRFTPEGVVSNVERFGLERGQVVTLSQRVTTPNVQGLTIIKQLMGSLGRLNPGQMLGGDANRGGPPGRL